MKKILTFALMLSMAACIMTQAAEPSPWTREGTFIDEADNYLSIMTPFEEGDTGWYVGGAIGDGLYGAAIPQEGESLHGNIDSEGGEFIVTVSEEGEDGILLTLENGEQYHFTPYEIPDADIVVTANTEGMGEIAYAEGEETPEFHEDSRTQSVYLGLEGPTTYSFDARAGEGYRFVKWTKNGKTFSTEPSVTAEFVEDADLVAVFMTFNPFAKEPVTDISEARTIGDVLGLPTYGTSIYEKAYVTAVELDDVVYRVIADLEEENAEALFSLDANDPEHLRKYADLASPLTISRIENLSGQIPSQEELDALAGKTFEELMGNGFTCSGWDLENKIIFMEQGPFQFKVVFDGEEISYEDFDEEDILPLTIASVTFDRIVNAASMEEFEG